MSYVLQPQIESRPPAMNPALLRAQTVGDQVPPALWRAGARGDNIAQLFRPPSSFQSNMFAGIGFPGLGNSITDLLQQLYGLLQQLFGGSSTSGEQMYSDATASSVGDPHLAFSGTQVNGVQQNAHFDSMVSHGDLIDSDSIPGGYQISTQVTAPNANGVTLNQRATITSNYGANQITMNNNGSVSITANGMPVQIQRGQTLDLGDGQTVTQNSDGSLEVINTNGGGGTINTTLSAAFGGVNVSTSAHNVDLGGDLPAATGNVQIDQQQHTMRHRPPEIDFANQPRVLA